MGQAISANLSRGTISVHIDQSDYAPEELFDFAERINPKRAFLFVSKVLGRHLAVSPAKIDETFTKLASKIDPNLPGPILVIGMAETAIGLGAGVHEKFSALNNRKDTVFLCTTRHDLGSERLASFSEDHSHATDHIIHMPSCTAVRKMLGQVRSLVLVDDEASTGNTFANLYKALPGALKEQLEKVVLVTLTDWSAGVAADLIDANVEMVSLAKGSFQWTPNKIVQGADNSVSLPSASSAMRPFTPRPESDWGRLGVTEHRRVLPYPKMYQGKGPVLVLGTGEHVWQPYRLAYTLETEGNEVSYASITRSPISIGHVIEEKFQFPDNYGLGVMNFCYNLVAGKYETIILCVETPYDMIAPELVQYLKSVANSVIVISSVEGVIYVTEMKELAA